MPEWQGKSKANKLGFRIFVWLIQTFGLKPAYLLLRFVSFYYFLFSWKTSVPVYKFYRVGLGFSPFKSARKLYENYYVFGQTLIDKTAVKAGIQANFTFDFIGEHHLRKMVAEKKGGLLFSAHAGNFEAAAHLLNRLETKINIVLFDGESEEIKNYMESVTGQNPHNLIFIKNDFSHIYKINQALALNEIICFTADRYMPGGKTISTDFFGKPAPFPEGPFRIGLKLNVPVAFVFAFKENNKHYNFYSSELKYFYQSNGDTIDDILKSFVANFELMVRKYPAQWFNYYDFWIK